MLFTIKNIETMLFLDICQPPSLPGGLPGSNMFALVYTAPSKSSRTICNSSNPTQYNQFSANTDAGYQTIWIEDQAQRFVGPDIRSILFVKGI